MNKSKKIVIIGLISAVVAVVLFVMRHGRDVTANSRLFLACEAEGKLLLMTDIGAGRVDGKEVLLASSEYSNAVSRLDKATEIVRHQLTRIDVEGPFIMADWCHSRQPDHGRGSDHDQSKAKISEEGRW